MWVVVLSTVVDHQLAVAKEKAIWLYFPRCLLDFILFFFTQIRQIINELPTVCRVRNHKAKLEGKFSNAFIAEVVSLYYFHVLDRLCTNAKVHSKADCFKLEEVWSQMILDQALWRIVIFWKRVIFNIVFWNLNQCYVRNHISYFEASEAELSPVVT